MNAEDTLEQIVSLNDLIGEDSRNTGQLAETLAQAEEELKALKMRQQRLILDLAKWAIQEGVAGPGDDLPIHDSTAFISTICDLIEEHEQLWRTNGTWH